MENDVKFLMCTIVLTRNCNLRCNFCFKKRAGYHANETIGFNELKNIVDFCSDAKMKYIFMSGGEPLLYPNLFDILRYIKGKQHPISTAIASNGVLLEDASLCKKLVDSGLDYIDISLKGMDGQTWRKATGLDKYVSQLRAIQNISSLPVELTCSMVVTPDNVSYVCETVRQAYEHGARQFSFTFIIDNNDSNEKDIAYLQKHNPFSLIEKFISNIDHLNKITTDWWIEYSFPMCVYTDEQLSMLKGKLASPCQIHFDNAVTIDANLKLLPCEMYIDQTMAKFGLDFSTYEDFIKIYELPQYRHAMASLQKLPSDECAICAHFTDCRGGCPVLWKNYSFEAMKKFKDSFIKSKIH